jgi:SAM-dependent methyltransferase
MVRQEFQVGDQFTPNEPQKWFDIVDEQTTLQFKANGGKTTTEHYKSEDLIIKPYKDTDRDGNPVTVYSLETKDGLYRSYQDTGSYSYWGNTELTPEDKKVYPHRGYNYMFVSNSLFKEHKEDYTKLLNELISGTNYRGYAGGGPVSIHDIKKGDKILDIKTNQVKTVESVDIWSERQVHDPYVSVWFDDGTMTRYPYLKHHGLKVEKYSNGGEKKYQNGGQFSDGGNIHLYDIPEGSTVYEVKVKDPLYKRGEPGVAESPYLYHFEYDGKNVWWHGDWNSNKHKFSKFKIVPKDRSSEEKEEKVTMTPLQESLSKMRVEGNTVYLPSDHIFSNYAEVKNALIKAGATYKRNSFVFPKDAQPYMDRLLGGEKINLKKQFQYFGTPAKLADKVVRLAEIKKGDKVLEPSAGQGAIVDAVHRVQPDIIVDVFELMEENRDVLLKKNVNFLGDNFVDIPAKYRNYYDVIVANPPFNKNQDIEHIRKMYDCLKPGGRLVSLASTHWKTSSNRKENEFASWISELGAFVEDIPPGEFKESGTGIATCIIVIDKPKNKADGGPVREDFIKLDNGTVFYVDKVPDLALDKRGKMSEHEAIKQGINLVFLKNFESDPSALDIAATEMGDTKQPTEAQVRRAMILKIGYEGFWYSLKAGGESGSDHLYSSSLSMDMEGPDGEDVEKVLIKKYNSDFNKILITEDEIRDIKDKIIKFRKRGKKIRDEKVQSIMQFLVMAEARGKYDVTGGGKKNYTEEFRNRIINMILEITDNENVVREEVHFRVKQHQDELDWMGDKECLYMLDEKYMTPERCKEETQKAKDKARKYIVIWKKLESDLLSRMSHEQAAEDGKEVDPSIPVMDEETYLAIHGASRQDIGDSALHKNRGGASDKVWTKIVDAQAKKDADLIKRRQQLREEYWVKVGQGELRPPTRIEKLIETAQGHPDNESVQAARRLLEKKGISWEKMAKDGQSISAETTANNWWRHTLSMNEQNTFAKKYLQNYEVDALIGSTAQFASADYHYKLITKIWRREGSPAYSEWLDKKYGYGDLTDSDLGMKIYYKTHPEYTGFKEKFTSSHAFNDWAKKAKDGSMIEFVDLNRAISLLKNFDINDLDAFERMQYDDFIKHSSKEQVLQILINNVEGDYSQLSPKLAEIAELQDGKAADGKSVKKQPLVNYVNKSITFLSIEEAKQAKKKLKDFDYSLIWEHGDGDWKEGMPNSMLTDRVMLFGNDVDFKISLNLLGLEYRDVSEYEWIFKTAWESTPNGVPFTDNIHGPHGSAFVIFPLPFHNEDDINRAKAWIRYQRDVVSLKVAGDHEWDDLYKSAYFRDPRTRALKWYQIEQDDKLIRKERKKGTTPKEFVDKFVLPHIGRTEDEMRKKHGEKMYQMANGGGIDIKTPLTLANGGPTGTSNVVKDASTLSLYFQELNKELGDQDKIIVRKLKDNSGINIYTNNWTESDNKNSVNAIHWGKDSANLMTKEQLIQHIEHINKVIPVTTFVELLDLKSKNKLIQDKIYLVTDEQLFYIATSQSGLYGPVEGVNSVNLQDYDITMEDVVTGYGEEDEGEEEERKVSRVFRLSFKANGRFENGALLEEMINGRVRKILSKAAKGKKVSEDPLIKEVEKDGIVSGRFGDAKLSSVVYQYGMKMYQVITDHTKGDEKTIIDVTPDDMGEEAEGDFFYDNGGIAARGKIIRKAGGGTKESEWKKKSGVWTHPLYGNTSLIQRGTPELPFTGIHADAYATKMPDGMEMGFDADMGWLVAYKGRLISIVDLPKEVKVIPFKKLKAKADNGLETETESYYIVRMWDTDEDKRKGVPPEEKKYKTRSEAVSQANHSYHEDNFGIVEVEDENSNRILTLDAYAKNGTEIDNIYKEAKKRYRSTLQNLTDDYEVELAAEPNPDYDRGSHEGTIRIKKHRVRVTSLEEARDKVVQFIQNNDLGSGNWSGGDLYQNGKKVGYVSYNGRVWNNDGTPKKDCHGTPMAFQGTAVATAPNLTDVIGFEEFSNKLPDIESPFVGEEGVIYKAKYDTYAGKMMYFKHGRRGLHSTSVAGAYINYLYDKYGIRFKDLSLEERKQLFGKFANRYKLEMFEEGGPVLVD